MAWHGPGMAKQNLHAARGSIEIGKGRETRGGEVCTVSRMSCIMYVCLGGQPPVGDGAALICTASAGGPLFSGAAGALPESLPNCKRGPRTYRLSISRQSTGSRLAALLLAAKTANCLSC
jgi:hypothetical protein